MTLEAATHLLPIAAFNDDLLTLCGRHRHTTPHVRIDHAQAHIDGHGMPVCPECVTVTGWACRRCGHVEHPPELFSPHPTLTVDACTRCAVAGPQEVNTS